MINAQEFVEAARGRGYTWYAGVPCSFLTPFINYVIGDDSLMYVSSANEGDAVAAAAGAHIGGKQAVAMMQNSGLGNAVSPLTSLTHVFRIPLLVICTHRGAPGVQDEPQHELMGQITRRMFDTMQVPWEEFPSRGGDIADCLARAQAHCAEAERPYALVMQKGAVAPHPLTNRPAPPRAAAAPARGELARPGEARPSRAAALERIIAGTPLSNSVVIATTGFTGRELYALDDRANQLYMVGSMGCASALGLGLALARPDKHVVVVDGDGAALMRMGNFATLGSYGPPNLSHLVLDNEAHDSTGAQATVSGIVDFAGIAHATGYAEAWRARSLDDIDAFLSRPRAHGAALLHLKIRTGTIDNLPRPTVQPPEAIRRLRQHLAGGA
jgi:phosphonopyruvate decarboxylase